MLGPFRALPPPLHHPESAGQPLEQFHAPSHAALCSIALAFLLHPVEVPPPRRSSLAKSCGFTPPTSTSKKLDDVSWPWTQQSEANAALLDACARATSSICCTALLRRVVAIADGCSNPPFHWSCQLSVSDCSAISGARIVGSASAGNRHSQGLVTQLVGGPASARPTVVVF